MRHVSLAATRIILVLAVLTPVCSAWASEAFTLAHAGQPRAAIVLPADPDPVEQEAANELRNHVQQISGAVLPVGSAPNGVAGLHPIYIGRAAPESERQATAGQLTDPASLALIVTRQQVSIFGPTAQGARNGVYELLEQLGVRWFMPGELGTVIPRRETLTVSAQRTFQNPSFASRWQHPSDATWQKRMRMGGPSLSGSAHGIPPFFGSREHRRKMLEQHPECFSWGENSQQRTISQQCVSNPKTIAMAADAARAYFRARPGHDMIGMGANDWGGFCECTDCKALDGGDWDPFSHAVSMTDRYVWFFNQVLEAIGDEFPDKQVLFYIYHSYMRPPVKVTPHPRLVGALAPIALCRIHGPGNPLCHEKQYYEWLLAQWGQRLSRLFERGYWFNLADPGLPFVMLHRLRVQIPMAHAKGLYGWRVETLTHWASESPSLYVASKLMWDHTADVDALLYDYARHYYGPAAEPMRDYVDLLDTAMRDADHHTGSAFDMPFIYPGSLRARARGMLDDAAQRAGDSVYGQRVRLTRQTFDYLEAFNRMLEQRVRHDHLAAKASLDQIDALQKKLIHGYDKPMINGRYAPSYLKRFFRLTTEQGYARVTDGNEPVAFLDDKWAFLADPQQLGEVLGYHRADMSGGNWQTIRASSSWSNQGLRYYKGEAWYRQTVTIPKRFADRRIFLWFGGVDEKAKVFVNGTEVGISHGGAFVPFEVDATKAVRAGAPNVVAVRVINQRLDELGTGGLTGPVMFYAPAAGDQAELENVRKMGRTFP